MIVLFPLLLLLFGIALGAGAAEFLGIAPAVVPPAEVADQRGADARPAADASTDADGRSIVSLERRIIAPLVKERDVHALVLVEVALDVPEELGQRATEAVPILRDRFLSALVHQAATGILDKGIGDPLVLNRLRDELRARAREVLEDERVEVLILEALMRPG